MFLVLSLAFAVPPPCDTFTPDLDGPIDTTCSEPDLVVAAPAACAGTCIEGTVTLWLPIENHGDASTAPTELRLYRRRTQSLSEVASLAVPVLAPAERFIVGPVVLTADQWGDGTLEARIDPRNAVAECDEDNTLDLGSFDPEPADDDDDGYRATDCGGLDCDDTNPAIYPGATDIVGDGTDQDCDGEDAKEPNCDLDADGATALGCGGDDCNDGDATVHPSATEIPTDGIDQDCDGIDFCPPNRWLIGGCSTGGGSPSIWAFLLFGALLRRRCA